MRLRLTVPLILLAFLATGARADPPYLEDLLKQPNYFAAYTSLVRTAAKKETWLTGYKGMPAGPTIPNTTVKMGAETMTVAAACKAHDCNERQLFVLFSADGGKAWGQLRLPEGTTFLGNPDAATRKALAAQVW